MKSSTRLLLGFGIGIGVLVIVAVILVLTVGRSEVTRLLPADTPEGTVQRFLIALKDQDYDAAFKYLSPPPFDGRQGETYDQWKGRVLGPGFPRTPPGTSWKASLGRTSVRGDQATVDVIIDVFRPSGPFENPVRSNTIVFTLSRTSGSWLITAPLDFWWLY